MKNESLTEKDRWIELIILMLRRLPLKDVQLIYRLTRLSF